MTMADLLSIVLPVVGVPMVGKAGAGVIAFLKKLRCVYWYGDVTKEDLQAAIRMVCCFVVLCACSCGMQARMNKASSFKQA